MDWMLASVCVALLLAAAPPIIAEQAARTLILPGLAPLRRRLWGGTVVVGVAVVAWLLSDRAAVGAGERPLAVAAVSVTAFVLLFAGLTSPIVRRARAAARLGR